MNERFSMDEYFTCLIYNYACYFRTKTAFRSGICFRSELFCCHEYQLNGSTCISKYRNLKHFCSIFFICIAKSFLTVIHFGTNHFINKWLVSVTRC